MRRAAPVARSMPRHRPASTTHRRPARRPGCGRSPARGGRARTAAPAARGCRRPATARSRTRRRRAAITLMSIAAVSCSCGTSGSGSAATSRSNDASPQFTNPCGAFLRTILRSFFGSSPAFAIERGVLDLVVGRHHDDGAGGVEPGATRAAGDLVELAGAELPHPLSVVFGERRDQHGADRHVDADAERVGAADHPQQAALGERLDEPAVPGQHAGVMHADAGADVARQHPSECRREAEAADRLGDRVALLAADDAERSTAPARAPSPPPARSARCRPAPGRSAAAPRPSRARGCGRTRSAAAPVARRR